MRLRSMEAAGLFGLFDHKISFNESERITIIHAPNGYGKTVMLKLIQGFFGGSLTLFRQIHFDSITFFLSDGGKVSVVQSNYEDRSFTIHHERDGESQVYDPKAPPESPSERPRIPISSQAIERHLPFLRRLSPRDYEDSRTRERFPVSEIRERYWNELPPNLRGRRQPPAWLQEIRSSVHCRVIETQRLLKISGGGDDFDDDEPELVPVVGTNSHELVGMIRIKLAESATLSQSLDRTFPNRLLSKATLAMSEADLRDRLNSLENKRARLAVAGVLDGSEDNDLILGGRFDDSTKAILTEYVSDAEKKLNVYDDLLFRLELLTDIINRRFQFKRLTVDRDQGLVFTDIKGRNVELPTLSSGEQHELVLVFDLLFRTRENTLLLIDEPEISLHVGWQRTFIPDLERIIALAPMDVVLSTHSPQLIGKYMDLAVELSGPKYDQQSS